MFVWALYLRWLLPRLVRPSPVNFFVNILAIACLGPGMLWALIYILDAMSVTRPSERDIAFYMYLAIAALLALYSLVRILQVQKHAKKSRDDGSRSV